MNTLAQTHTLYGPGFEATLSWTFVSTDSAQVIIHLRATQGKTFDVVRRVELIPRHPERVTHENAWISLSLVKQRHYLELYVSIPQQSGAVRCELLERARADHHIAAIRMAASS